MDICLDSQRTWEKKSVNNKVLLFYNIFIIARRKCYKRFFKTCNKEIPEIPGCKERLNFDFIEYVATYNKTKRHIIADNLKNISKDKVLIFKKQKDLNE